MAGNGLVGEHTDMTGASRWRFWVDRGGTFTDVVALSPDGALHTLKLLSEDPGRYRDAATAAIRLLTGVADRESLPPAELRIGTTVATNALLERKGEPTCLVTTRGFGDALRIGYQERPELFARQILLPEPVQSRVIEVDERIGAGGELVTPLDLAGAEVALRAARGEGINALAIVFMHGFRFPAHEQAIATLARSLGFAQVSASHEVAPLIKLVSRGDTTVVDAYLSPVVRRYVEGLTAELGDDVETLFMQSGGGLATGAAFRGRDAVLSGPAGGIVGLARTARAAGFDRVIGFDMGGTSTDVSHYAGAYERDSETRVAGARIRAPMMGIHTIAAGGGSICRFASGRFQVGPGSAGAVPGPACYRRGGPLTVTDCNVMLGKIVPAHFPAVFGPDGDAPLDDGAVRARFADLLDGLPPQMREGLSPEAAAQGFIDIAVANMANAIKRISVARGHDVTGYTLSCFGGAGGQHACLVADALAMERVMIHPLAGVLSAYGMGLADRQATRERTVTLSLDPAQGATISAHAAALDAAARQDLVAQGIAEEGITSSVTAQLRTAGGEALIGVLLSSVEAMRAGFMARHKAEFGFAYDGEIIVEALSADAVHAGEGEADEAVFARGLPAVSGPPVERTRCFMGGMWRDVPLYRREDLAVGHEAEGPAIIIDAVSTTVVEPGWRLRVDALANLILERAGAVSMASADDGDAAVDPIRLEIFNGLFMAAAEEMGAALQRSAASVNIRERLDFSCAIFDAQGNLVANAPHMPVHLGSMGESVRAILRRRGDGRDGRGIRPGDAYALNAPYEGGTHLPDITVVMPVFADADAPAPAFFVAARGHHADLGGISPGSMPPDSRTVDEEGILFDNLLIVEDGRFLEADVLALLSAGRWPARNPARNIGDLMAQVAACARGAAELAGMSAEHGLGVVQAYMRHVQANAEEAVRALLLRLEDGAFTYEMDDGAMVAVRLSIDRAARAATFDFTGSSPQLASNFNAPLPVVRAAVLYVLRTLIDDPIPMNEGCLRPVTIIAPEGSFINPRYPAAVVAGNVETSQVITDALFGAVGAMAGAQGTMNNFTFGNARHQYYETIAGGAGAGPGFAGASAVQTHMTNSRLTDPEILETRFPVRLEHFSIRAGSGGAGRWRGGDGVVRCVRFLEPMSAGILSNRRRVPPFGLAGGGSGAPGINRVVRADGRDEPLGATASAEMEAGDMFVIETPGGGGFGAPDGDGTR